MHAAPALPGRVRRVPLTPEAPHAWGWLLGPLLLLAVWAAASGLGLVDSRTLPAPWATVRTAAHLIAEGRLQADVAVSAWRALQGLFFGVVLGVAVALLSGLSRIGGYLFDGVIQMKRGIPTLALIPLFILWLGIGESMKITVIALLVFLQIYLHTHDALRSIDLRYVELAESLRLSRTAFLRHVALPGFLLGLRTGVAQAWIALVVVEGVNATSGIGYMITLARTLRSIEALRMLTQRCHGAHGCHSPEKGVAQPSANASMRRPTSSPAESSNAWRWRARWCERRSCCCSPTSLLALPTH